MTPKTDISPGQTFRPDQPKNSAAGKKFGPLQNLSDKMHVKKVIPEKSIFWE
jgi:hypothetical protein